MLLIFVSINCSMKNEICEQLIDMHCYYIQYDLGDPKLAQIAAATPIRAPPPPRFGRS